MTENWTFQNKVTGGFAVMVGLAVLTAAVTLFALRAVVSSKDRVLSVNAQNLIDAAKLDAAADRQAAAFRGFLATGEERFAQERVTATEEFTTLLHGLEGRILTEREKTLFADVQRADADLMGMQDRATRLLQTDGKRPAALQVFADEIFPQRGRLVQRLDAFVALQQQLLDEANRASSAQASLSEMLVMGLSVAAVLFAALTAFLLSRTLTRQIGAAVQHVQGSSSELQSSASQQSATARETASSLNEVTTTMSELLVTSRQISESAQQVAHIAQQTAGAARAGDETVAKMQEAIEAIRRQVDLIVTHMLDLGKKSQQVGGILDIINELSEQTNILSINATIEAAGAGEAGKRFSVVGEEIRKLADRVTGSTKEIRALLEEIRAAVNTTVLATEGGSKAVDAGLRHFEEVNRGFKQIATLVVTTTEAAREIELSTKQQTSAVEQVNAAIGGAAQASREAEASTSQTLQTATQLAHLSHDLSRIVQPHAA